MNKTGSAISLPRNILFVPSHFFANNGQTVSRYGLKVVPGSVKYDGYLYRAVLSEAQNVDGISLPMGTFVWIQNGKLTGVTFPSDTLFRGIMWRGTTSTVHEERYKHSVGLHNGRITRGLLAKQTPITFKATPSSSTKIRTFPADTVLDFDVNSGALRSIAAPTSINIDGITLMGNSRQISKSTYSNPEIYFHKNGNVSRGILDRDTTLNGVVVPKHSHVEFDDRGRLIRTYPARDTVINGMTFAGNQYFSKSKSVQFNVDGKLAGGNLASDHVIQGIPVAKSKWARSWKSAMTDEDYGEYMYVSFQRSGVLADAYLSKDFIIDGVECAKETKVTFFPNKRLKSAVLSKDQIIQGISVRRGQSGCYWGNCPHLEFYDNGRIKTAVMNKNQIIQGIPCRGSKMFYLKNSFYKNGKLKSAYLSEDFTLNGATYSKDSEIHMHENGKIKSAVLANDSVIQGIPCKKGENVEFHENGRLMKATLSAPKTINGLLCPQGKQIELLKNGDLKWDCR